MVKTDNSNRIMEYMHSHRREMEDFLGRLIEFESPSSDPESQIPLMDFIAKQFEALHYRCVRFHGRKTGGFLTAADKSRKKYQPFQLLVGHCDTVWEKGTLKHMPLINNDEKIKGPGSFDMKAGLTQMIFSIRALRDLSLDPEVLPYCFINSDEEIGSRESTSSLIRLSKIADRAYVLEPPLGPLGALKTSRKGLGRFTIQITGKAAHAGLNPEEGSSAILELSHQIQKLFALNDPDKGITVNVGMIEGGVSANVVAPYSSAVADVRVRTSEDARILQEKILGFKPLDPRIKLNIEGIFGRPPMEMTNRNKLLWKAACITGEQLNLQLQDAAAGGGSDANTTSQYTATLDGLGTTGGGAHATHEHILKDKLLERASLLSMMLMLPPLPRLKSIL